jgi:hypothetical protein
MRSRDGSGIIALGLVPDVEGSIHSKGKFFLNFTAPRPTLGPTQPPIEWVSEANYTERKLPGLEAEHSPPSRSEVTNGAALTPPARLSSCHII